MQVEKFVTALVQSLDSTEILSVLTDAQKQAIIGDFFANAKKDDILGLMTEEQKSEFVADVEEEEEDVDVDLDTVDPDELVRYVGDVLEGSILDYLDGCTLAEYVWENHRRKVLDYSGITDHVDSLRDLLDILE